MLEDPGHDLGVEARVKAPVGGGLEPGEPGSGQGAVAEEPGGRCRVRERGRPGAEPGAGAVVARRVLAAGPRLEQDQAVDEVRACGGGEHRGVPAHRMAEHRRAAADQLQDGGDVADVRGAGDICRAAGARPVAALVDQHGPELREGLGGGQQLTRVAGEPVEQDDHRQLPAAVGVAQLRAVDPYAPLCELHVLIVRPPFHEDRPAESTGWQVPRSRSGYLRGPTSGLIMIKQGLSPQRPCTSSRGSKPHAV